MTRSNGSGETERVFWATVWLAVALVAVKAFYLGVPDRPTVDDFQDHVRSIAAISYRDVLFTAVLWASPHLALTLAGSRATLRRFVSPAFVVIAALLCAYNLANVVLFDVFGGSLTYPMFLMVGRVPMLSASVAAHLTTRVVVALVGVPLAYLLLVEATIRALPAPKLNTSSLGSHGLAAVLLVVWVAYGQHSFATSRAMKPDWRIAENAEWVFVSSWWPKVAGERTVLLPTRFDESAPADFEPIDGRSTPSSFPQGDRHRAANVIMLVLESVGARWTSLNGRLYDTTPHLKDESSRALVFDNAYAHIGRSSNALVAILMSAYPKLDFRDISDEYPQLPGTTLATILRSRGYRTEFITSSDMSWAGLNTFLQGRGFDSLRDYRDLSCTEPLSEWGVEDRCLVDGMIDFITQKAADPFFLMGWTTQAHYPYEPTPGVPLIDMHREPGPDDWDLERYLNVLHETDRHLARLFDAVRRAGLDQDTLVVVVGDHGQAFGYPHASYGQGRTVYEEDVHIPLMFWFPRLYASASRSKTIGSQVDLAPTIADLVGVSPAPDWQGRSLFASRRSPRAYFYVAEDRFTLGVRENSWKYLLDLRAGIDELYDLDRDPDEQQNLATVAPERGAQLRERLAAWMEANRRRYE